MPVLSAGANFRAALKAESPLQVIGAINATAGEVDRRKPGAFGEQGVVRGGGTDYLKG